MSVEDRPKKPDLDLGTENDWDEALSKLEPQVDEASASETDPDEGDALLALLLDESEHPEEVAPRELPQPAQGLAHSAALDMEPLGQFEIDVDEDDAPLDLDPEGEPTPTPRPLPAPSPLADSTLLPDPSPLPDPPTVAEAAPVEVYEPPSAPKLLVPVVRQFSPEDDTQIYAAPRPEPAPEPEPEPDSIPAPALSLSPPPPPPPAPFPHERPASAHLEESGRLDAFLARAAFLEAEAREANDPGVRARGFLLAAEIAGMAGDESRARELAQAAKQTAPGHPLAHRLSRSLALGDGDFGAAVASLDAEGRTAKLPAARAHAALLAAEIARIQLGDREGYEAHLSQALRAAPNDVRALLALLIGALAEEQPVPRLRFGEALSSAAHALARFRDAEGEVPPSEPIPVDSLRRARLAFEARDPEAAVAALEALAALPGLGEGAAWLGAAIAAGSPKTRSKAVAFLEKCREGSQASMALRRLAARALEIGDTETIASALAEAPAGTWKPVDRLALAALSGAGLPEIEPTLADAVGDPELFPLAAGIASAVAEPGLLARAEWTAGSPEAQARLRLARMLAAKASAAEKREALEMLEAGGSTPLGFALSAELNLAEGRLDAIAEALTKASLSTTIASERDRALAAGLLYELSGDRERAHAEYERARQVDPAFEAALRASNATATDDDAQARLLEHGAALENPTRAAFVFLEAALRAAGASTDADAPLLQRAHEKAPSLPFASFLLDRRARARGDLDARLSLLREHREASEDPIETAHALAREALLVEARDPALAANLLEEASRACASDIALRELFERLAPEPPPDRASYWAARAEASTGPERAWLALFAALDFERQGETEAASRFARMAVEAGDQHLAPHCLSRTGKGTAPSYRSILEESPGHLPSLRALEHQLIGEGREDELEPVFSEIAKSLRDPESTSHAIIAARLRLRRSPAASIRDLVEAAGRVEPRSLWALREIESGSDARGDDREVMVAAEQLARRTDRPLEKATLFLRAGEAAARLGDDPKARDFLVSALEHEPAHPVALGLLAEIAERLGESERAAIAYERLAATSRVDAHKLDAYGRAAVLFLDHLGDSERGGAALEAAAAIDPSYPDVVDRLRAMYVAKGDDAGLAKLLERRLEQEAEPGEKVKLQIERARLLVGIGDFETAKAALLEALEAKPDHLEALHALADVCTRREDWAGLEDALLRLASLAPTADEQASFYMRLGDLYRERLANPERAEAAYREVVSRQPDELSAREALVEVYGNTGEGGKALEVQEWLLETAGAEDEKKQRTLELARVHEQLMGDARKAEATLEALRKELPTDADVLEALVSLLRRSSREVEADALLDKTASEARRALATGRFDPSLFALLAAVARIRGGFDAARIAEATLGALEGRAVEIAGVGMEAARPLFDDLLAPDLLTPALRTLLKRTGEALDAAVPFDLHAVRALPLPEAHAALGEEVRQLAEGFGMTVEVFCSPALGPVCVPASSSPARIVLGMPLVLSSEETVRRFLILRALKVMAAHAAGFARTAPVDLFPLVAGYLQSFVPDWQSHGADLAKVAAYRETITSALPKHLEGDTAALAREIVDHIGNRSSTLNAVVNGWGNRVALLAIGDPMAALTGIAWAGGNLNGPPSSGRDRITWIGRNAEARDLVTFSVGEAYAEARSRLDAD